MLLNRSKQMVQLHSSFHLLFISFVRIFTLCSSIEYGEIRYLWLLPNSRYASYGAPFVLDLAVLSD
jgi:hypothetical protein